MFEQLYEKIEALRNISQETVHLTDWLIVFGGLIAIWLSFKLLLLVIRDLRLYVFSQLFKTDYVKRYGKWALVTGATDGIGFELARELARRGHSLILVGRNEQKLAKCKKIFEKERKSPSCEIMTILMDLSNPSLDEYERIEQEIDPVNRDIGILINNAGLGSILSTRFHNHEPANMIDMINVNCFALARMTRMVLPGMLARERGLIVNVSSVLGDPTFVAVYNNLYSPTKAFVQQFSRQLQQEYRNYPIDVIDFNCGFINGGMWQRHSVRNFVDWFLVGTEKVAKTFINCMATRYAFITGHWLNDIQKFNHSMAHALNMHPFFDDIIIKIAFKQTNLTPKNGRRSHTVGPMSV